jgi:hypothetical protein
MRRANIAKEILYTENSYVQNMKTVVQVRIVEYIKRKKKCNRVPRSVIYGDQKVYQPLCVLADSKRPVLKQQGTLCLFLSVACSPLAVRFFFFFLSA